MRSRATLEAIVASPESFPRDVDPRLGLYRTFHAIWSTANVEEGEEPNNDYSRPEGIAQARLSRITPLSRQALLLTSLEGFSSEDAAYLIGASPERHVSVEHGQVRMNPISGTFRLTGPATQVERGGLLALADESSGTPIGARVARAEATYMQSVNLLAQAAINARSEAR